MMPKTKQKHMVLFENMDYFFLFHIQKHVFCTDVCLKDVTKLPWLQPKKVKGQFLQIRDANNSTSIHSRVSFKVGNEGGDRFEV